jgi:hypothetical protein
MDITYFLKLYQNNPTFIPNFDEIKPSIILNNEYDNTKTREHKKTSGKKVGK